MSSQQHEAFTHDVVSRVIWSADVPDEANMMEYLGRVPDLRRLKVDRSFLEGGDLGILDRLAEAGYQVFDDAKIIEIPHKVVAIAKKHLNRAHPPWMLNCMADIWSTDDMDATDPEKLDGLKRFADACHQAGTRPCAVTVLTSKKRSVVAREFNSRTATEQVLMYVEALWAADFTDVVCSPQEVAAIRANSQFKNLALNTPGIRFAGSDEGDQAKERTSTPGGAILNGSDNIVMGSDLTKGDIAANFARAAAEVKAALMMKQH